MKILTTIAKILIVPVLAVAVVALAAPATYASTDCTAGGTNVTIKTGKNCAQGEGTQNTLFEPDANGNSLFKTVTNVLLFLIGAVSVIMLIIGGIRYTLSNGDSGQVTSAKNTILYAVIGIIVALLAYAIVNFVVSSFTVQSGGAAVRADR